MADDSADILVLADRIRATLLYGTCTGRLTAACQAVERQVVPQVAAEDGRQDTPPALLSSDAQQVVPPPIAAAAGEHYAETACEEDVSIDSLRMRLSDIFDQIDAADLEVAVAGALSKDKEASPAAEIEDLRISVFDKLSNLAEAGRLEATIGSALGGNTEVADLQIEENLTPPPKEQDLKRQLFRKLSAGIESGALEEALQQLQEEGPTSAPPPLVAEVAKPSAHNGGPRLACGGDLRSQLMSSLMESMETGALQEALQEVQDERGDLAEAPRAADVAEPSAQVNGPPGQQGCDLKKNLLRKLSDGVDSGALVMAFQEIQEEAAEPATAPPVAEAAEATRDGKMPCRAERKHLKTKLLSGFSSGIETGALEEILQQVQDENARQMSPTAAKDSADEAAEMAFQEIQEGGADPATAPLVEEAAEATQDRKIPSRAERKQLKTKLLSGFSSGIETGALEEVLQQVQDENARQMSPTAAKDSADQATGCTQGGLDIKDVRNRLLNSFLDASAADALEDALQHAVSDDAVVATGPIAEVAESAREDSASQTSAVSFRSMLFSSFSKSLHAGTLDVAIRKALGHREAAPLTCEASTSLPSSVSLRRMACDAISQALHAGTLDAAVRSAFSHQVEDKVTAHTEEFHSPGPPVESFRGQLLNSLVQAVETGSLETILQDIHAERVGQPVVAVPQEPVPPTAAKESPKGSAFELIAALSRRDRRVGELAAMVKEAESELARREEQCMHMEKLVDAARQDLTHLQLDIESRRRALVDADRWQSELKEKPMPLEHGCQTSRSDLSTAATTRSAFSSC